MAGGPTRIMCFSFVGMEVDVVNLPWGKKSVGQNFQGLDVRQEGGREGVQEIGVSDVNCK